MWKEVSWEFSMGFSMFLDVFFQCFVANLFLRVHPKLLERSLQTLGTKNQLGTFSL